MWFMTFISGEILRDRVVPARMDGSSEWGRCIGVGDCLRMGGIGEWWDVCGRLDLDAAVKLVVVFALSGTSGSGGAVDLFAHTLLWSQTVSNSSVGGKERMLGWCRW